MTWRVETSATTRLRFDHNGKLVGGWSLSDGHFYVVESYVTRER